MKTISNEQIKIAKHLMDLQMEIDNRIRNNIQENFLRYPMDDKTLETQLDSLEDSVKYILEEKIRLIKVSV